MNTGVANMEFHWRSKLKKVINDFSIYIYLLFRCLLTSIENLIQIRRDVFVVEVISSDDGMARGFMQNVISGQKLFVVLINLTYTPNLATHYKGDSSKIFLLTIVFVFSSVRTNYQLFISTQVFSLKLLLIDLSNQIVGCDYGVSNLKWSYFPKFYTYI